MIIQANSLYIPLKDESVHCIVTSPPYYGLRKYNIPDSIWDGEVACDHQWNEIVVPATNGIIHDGGMSGEKLSGNSATRRPRRSKLCVKCGAWKGQLGGEPSIGLYVSHLVQTFREVRRVLRRDGVLWLNLGDSYASGKGSCYNSGGGERSLGKHLKNAGVHYLQRSNISDLRKEGLKPKDLCEIPSEVVRALRDDGWWLRSRIPWVKMNSMPGSCTDRPMVSIEYVFLLTKSRRYFYDTEAVRMPAGRTRSHGKNSRMNVDRDPAHLTPYRSGNKLRKVSDGEYGRVNNHLGSSVPWEDDGTGRYRRDSDWFFESLRGLLSDDAGNPLALFVSPGSYKGAHYSTFPERLVEPMIKAGTSEKGCCSKCGKPWEREIEKTFVPQQDVSPENGIRGAMEQKPMDASSRWDGVPRGSNVIKTIGWQPTCSCGVNGNDLKPDDLETILSPTGERSDADPSLITGRAGFNRPRGENEGTHPMTRYEQRQYAAQLKNSPQREEMANQAGEAFAHYLRTDKSGARPIPEKLLEEWIGKGWIERVEVPKFEPYLSVPCVVFDPFHGSGTTGAVAERLNRRWVGLDLGYQNLQRERLAGIQKEMPLIG